MRSIVAATDRKPEATMRNDWGSPQGEMPFLAAVKPPHLAPESFVSLASWEGALRYTVQRSGYDDYEVADELPISHGYMSRVMRGTANLDGDKLVKLMRLTQSAAPLQWLADQMGFELKEKQPESELDRLRRENAALKARAA